MSKKTNGRQVYFIDGTRGKEWDFEKEEVKEALLDRIEKGGEKVPRDKDEVDVEMNISSYGSARITIKGKKR